MNDFFFFFFDEDNNTTNIIPAEYLEPEHAMFDQFDSSNIRMVWHKQQEKWYFSIVDVVQALTDSADGRKYWNKLKQRLSEEGSELVTNCHQLKLRSPKDGKFYKSDVADAEQLLRLIQSVPSPKAEPFKLWLAKVGSERLDEMSDPDGMTPQKQTGF